MDERSPLRAAQPPPPPPPAVDYPELAVVERRHYAVYGEIAKGGMGRVLDARDLRLGRAVAIKELLPRYRGAARRFEREARITARLQHPAIIHVYEAGVWPGGEPFYAMPKVTGRSLAQVVVERTTLAERLGLLPNVIAVADALAYAHSQDVIHRDLTPANVLVGGFGETVVIDWGLAKDLRAPADPAASLEMRIHPEETQSGSIVGTPSYMPPEQARGEPVDHRADVYALGAMLYKVLTGLSPYRAASSKEVVELVLAGPPVPVDEREPGAPPDLVAIVNKAMARDPVDRYPTAGELAADLKRFETGQLVAAHRYTRRQLLVRWIQRHRVAAIAITMFAIVGAVFVWQILSQKERAETEKERAETEQHKAELRRAALLEERGRSELLAGRHGPALAYLAGASPKALNRRLGFMIAEAMRPFEAEIATVTAGGEGTVLLAYRPDGTELATASADGVIKTWDAKGHPLRDVDRGHGGVHALVWSADGALLATAGDDRVIRVWSADGTPVHTLRGHTGVIRNLAFSPDGTQLVSTSADRTARLWHLASEQGGELVKYDSGTTVAEFSPDGTRIVIGGEDGTAEVIGLQSQSSDFPLRAHDHAILAAHWNPNAEPNKDRIVTASADGTARVWDPAMGKQVMLMIQHRAEVPIDDATWSSDGRMVITAGGDQVARVWQVPDPPTAGQLPAPARLMWELPHTDRVTRARFSADDRFIVTAGNDRVVRVWDGGNGRPVAVFEASAAIASVELSRDGSTVIGGCLDGTARLWDLTRGITKRQEPLSSSSAIHAIAVARDGRVAAGMYDGRVWSWQAGKPQLLGTHVGQVFAVAFSPDGTKLATAGEDPYVFVRTVDGSTSPLELAIGEAPIRAVAFTNGSIVAGDAAGTLWRWSATGTPKKARSLDAPIVALAVHPAGTWIAVATEHGVEILDAEGQRVGLIPRTTPVTAIAFDPRGETLAISGSVETTIARFTAGTTTPLLSLEGPTGEVSGMAFDRDASLLFTGSRDGVTRVWDVAKGKLLATREAGGGAIEAIALTADDQLLWTANADGTARALDVHVQQDAAGLTEFIKQHVPYRLGDDDVVIRAR